MTKDEEEENEGLKTFYCSAQVNLTIEAKNEEEAKDCLFDQLSCADKIQYIDVVSYD